MDLTSITSARKLGLRWSEKPSDCTQCGYFTRTGIRGRQGNYCLARAAIYKNAFLIRQPQRYQEMPWFIGGNLETCAYMLRRVEALPW